MLRLFFIQFMALSKYLVTNDSIFYYKQILREVQVHSLWNEKSEKSHPDYDRFRDGLGRLV